MHSRRSADNERQRFMARYGVLSGAFFALVVVAEAIPKLMLKMGQ